MAAAKRVRVRAYSSSANLGPGFDALAVAHTAFYDEVEARLEPGNGMVLVEAVYGPFASEAGGAATAVKAVEELLRITGGLEGSDVVLRVYKGVPPGKGLGSSGASAAAAVKAVALLLELEVDDTTLVEAAGRGEAAAAGQPHYDNVAASLLGGLAVVAPDAEGRIYTLSIPFKAYFTVYVPRGGVSRFKTKVMREVLPASVSLHAAARNGARAAMIAAAAAAGRLDVIGAMMLSDEIVEPARSKFVPCYSEARRVLLDAGALGVSISGAGPSLIALARGREHAEALAEELVRRCHCCDPETVKAVETAPGASRV